MFVILKVLSFFLQWQECAEPEVRAAESPGEAQGTPGEERA